jgi:hypothetical protein
MIFALLLLAQSAQVEGFTPQEQRGVVAVMECLKRHVDTVPRRERRRRGEELIEEALSTCSGEVAAFRAVLRTRYNEQSTEWVLEMVRGISRDGMRRYVRR